jgi:hypothetical protein
MIFAIIIILLFGGIAYFHYAQGFFSATLSALCAAVAAVIALGYQETVVLGLLQGAAGDYANAMVTMGLFALVYLVLRTILDKAIPGQIRLPHALDKVGGGAVGLIAAMFACGVIALSAQMLPFGPSILGYARYTVEDHPEVTIPPAPGRSNQRTADIHAQLTDTTFTDENHKKLLLPVDDAVVNFVSMVSNGALSGAQPLNAVHPNWPDELFGQRLGVQTGGKKVAMNLPGKTPQVSVPDKGGVYRVDADLSKTALDAEIDSLHDRPVKPAKGALQLVVRVMFSKDAADSDGNVRLALSAVRLVANGTTYYPSGTLENGRLWANKLDDFLFINVKGEDRGADFVFMIDNPSDVIAGGAKDPEPKIKDGVFIEVKRLALVDLSGYAVTPAMPKTPKNIRVERKETVQKKAGVTPTKEGDSSGGGGGGGGGGGAAATPASDLPFVYASANVKKTLFSPVNTGSAEKDVKNAQTQSGTLSTQSGQFTMLDINPTQSLTILKQGYPVEELFEPAGQKLVQIEGAPQPEGGDPWAWGSLSKWQLVDAAGKTYTPNGGFAKVKKDQADRMVAVYNANGKPNDVSGDGRPTQFWVAFLVPSGTHLKEAKYDGKTVASLDQAVP